jgi:hypothetical protein
MSIQRPQQYVTDDSHACCTHGVQAIQRQAPCGSLLIVHHINHRRHYNSHVLCTHGRQAVHCYKPYIATAPSLLNVHLINHHLLIHLIPAGPNHH